MRKVNDSDVDKDDLKSMRGKQIFQITNKHKYYNKLFLLMLLSETIEEREDENR